MRNLHVGLVWIGSSQIPADLLRRPVQFELFTNQTPQISIPLKLAFTLIGGPFDGFFVSSNGRVALIPNQIALDLTGDHTAMAV